MGSGNLTAYHLPPDFGAVHTVIGGLPVNEFWAALASDPKTTHEIGTEWHHYAVAYNHVDQTFTLWRDGEQQTGYTPSGRGAGTPSPLTDGSVPTRTT